MNPWHHTNDHELISRWLIFHDFSWFSKVDRSFWWSRCRTEKSMTPSDRELKMIMRHIEFISFHLFHPEISWGQGSPVLLCGGWGPGQSGAPLWPRGKFFAPFGPYDGISKIANAEARVECFAHSPHKMESLQSQTWSQRRLLRTTLTEIK